MVRLGAGLVNRCKDALPGAPHFLSMIKTLAIIAVQGLGNKDRQGVAHRRVEEPAVERHFAVQHGGIGLAIAPLWQHASGHLVECHGNRKALGVQIPAGGLTAPQERIQIGRRASTDVLYGRMG